MSAPEMIALKYVLASAVEDIILIKTGLFSVVKYRIFKMALA